MTNDFSRWWRRYDRERDYIGLPRTGFTDAWEAYRAGQTPTEAASEAARIMDAQGPEYRAERLRNLDPDYLRERE